MKDDMNMAHLQDLIDNDKQYGEMVMNVAALYLASAIAFLLMKAKESSELADEANKAADDAAMYAFPNDEYSRVLTAMGLKSASINKAGEMAVSAVMDMIIPPPTTHNIPVNGVMGFSAN